MLKKSSVSMIVLLVVATASLIAISSIYQYEERQALPAATAQSQRQLGSNPLGNVLVGKIDSFKYYSSSDGKACTVFVRISEGTARIYSPNNVPFPFGLKLGDHINLVVPDQTMCVLLGQANIAKMEFQFYVALPPVNSKALPPGIQKYFPPEIYPRLYRVVEVNIPFPGSIAIKLLSQSKCMASTDEEGGNLGEELERLASRLNRLEDDYIMRLVDINYRAMIRKAKAVGKTVNGKERISRVSEVISATVACGKKGSSVHYTKCVRK